MHSHPLWLIHYTWGVVAQHKTTPHHDVLSFWTCSRCCSTIAIHDPLPFNKSRATQTHPPMGPDSANSSFNYNTMRPCLVFMLLMEKKCCKAHHSKLSDLACYNLHVTHLNFKLELCKSQFFLQNNYNSNKLVNSWVPSNCTIGLWVP
jgi:hypothetical protein